jgi:hypothetical protein
MLSFLRPTSRLGLTTFFLVLSAWFVHAAPPREDNAATLNPDPYADPHNDMRNPLRYIASNTLTGISFALVLTVAVLQTFCTFKWGARYMLAMVIGGYTFALGLATRFGLHNDPRSKGLYIVEYLFVVLSPCAFIAATYVLLGRLARYLKCNELLLITPQRITATFITSDIVTFLIQAAGGGVSASADDTKTAKMGSRIFLIGLALQLASFVVFTTVYVVFLFRIYSQRSDLWKRDSAHKWYNDWRALAGALALSCIGILIRSVFRTVELSEGYAGYLATHEVYFYTLDTLPLFLAIVVFIPFWPGRFLSFSDGEMKNDVEVVSSTREMPTEK